MKEVLLSYKDAASSDKVNHWQWLSSAVAQASELVALSRALLRCEAKRLVVGAERALTAATRSLLGATLLSASHAAKASCSARCDGRLCTAVARRRHCGNRRHIIDRLPLGRALLLPLTALGKRAIDAVRCVFSARHAVCFATRRAESARRLFARSQRSGTRAC